MKAFFGKQEIKDKYVNRMKAHIEADELIQGTGFDDGKGCFIGCTLNNYSHLQYEEELNIPVELARLFDEIFEQLEIEDSKNFSLQIYDSIEVGADLSEVVRKFKIYLMNFVLQFVQDEKHTKQKEAIEAVKNLLLKKYIDAQEWSKCRMGLDGCSNFINEPIFVGEAIYAASNALDLDHKGSAANCARASDAAYLDSDHYYSSSDDYYAWMSHKDALLNLLRECKGESE